MSEYEPFSLPCTSKGAGTFWMTRKHASRSVDSCYGTANLLTVSPKGAGLPVFPRKYMNGAR